MANLQLPAGMQNASIDALAKFESFRRVAKNRKLLQRHNGYSRECEKLISQFMKQAKFETVRLNKVQLVYREKFRILEKAEASSPARLLGHVHHVTGVTSHPGGVAAIQLTRTPHSGAATQSPQHVATGQVSRSPHSVATMQVSRTSQNAPTVQVSRSSQSTATMQDSQTPSFMTTVQVPQHLQNEAPLQSPRSHAARSSNARSSAARSSSVATRSSAARSGSVAFSSFTKSSAATSQRRLPHSRKQKRQLLFRIEKTDGKITYVDGADVPRGDDATVLPDIHYRR